MPSFAPARRLSAVALAAVVLALGACGDDNDTDTGGGAAVTTAPATETQPATETTATTEATAGDVVNVTIKDITFIPEQITAKVGQKIVWTHNDGSIPHDVTATEPANLFKSKTLTNGDTFEYTPKKAGEIDYVCTIHSGQKGAITVTE